VPTKNRRKIKDAARRASTPAVKKSPAKKANSRAKSAI